MRKYLNDSRYPYDAKIYTKDFYEECLAAILNVKDEIDSANSKKSLEESLGEKFGKDKVNKKD